LTIQPKGIPFLYFWNWSKGPSPISHPYVETHLSLATRVNSAECFYSCSRESYT